MKGGAGVGRVATAVAGLVVALTACTQGLTSEAGGAGEPVRSTTPPSDAATTVASSTTEVPPAAPSTTAVAVSSSLAPSTTVSTRPPTVAEEFAIALAPAQLTVLGAPIPASARDSVARLWLLLGRPPTTPELETAVTAVVRDGVTLDALATLLLSSPENPVGKPDAPSERFVAGLYEGMLGREGRPGEVAAWVRGMSGGMSAGDVVVGFAESPEAVRRTGTTAHGSLPVVSLAGVSRSVSDSVLRLYLGLLERLPTTDELARDVDRYRHGAPLSAVADGILQSGEYRDRRPDGDPAAVIAGLFEDVLGTHPSPTIVGGWAAQLDSRTSAGEVAAAFLDSPAVVARTGTEPPVAPAVDPVLPAPVAIMPGTEILAVGDSIMLGASSALERQFPGIAIDAKVGRQFAEGVEIVRSLAANGTIPDIVVIHLGTNGAVGAATCDAMFGLLAGKRVVIVNLHVPRPWERPNNEVLEACAARHGAAIVDWHTNAVGLAHDGYHLGGSAPAAYAALIAAALEPIVR